MKYFLSIIIISFLLSCDDENTNEQIVNSNSYSVERDTVEVDWVVDGDTFRFIDEEFGELTVRVLDCDAFEISDNDRAKQQAEANNMTVEDVIQKGNDALYWLIDNFKFETVIIVRDPNENDKDVYNRLLRKVYWNESPYDSLIKARGWDSGL